MTLEELIDHEEKESKATWNGKPTLCAEEHRQLAEWLKELKQLRKQVNSSENPNKRNKSEARRWKRRYLDLKQRMFKLEEQTRWIPVSERLPEAYKEVIVTDTETSDTYQSQYIGNGYWECDNGLFMNRIIAWMSKPEPYKKSDRSRRE